MSRCPDPTIDEVLGDAMIRAVMQADHVDPVRFAASLRSIAAHARIRDGLGRASFAAAMPAPTHTAARCKNT